MRTRLPPSFVNPITMIGVAIAAVSFIVIVFLAVLEYFDPAGSPYMGILAFVIVPSIMLSGLAVAAFGIWREHRRNRIGMPDRRMPVLDLNNPRHRTAVSLVSFGSLALILFSSFGSFKAYEAMESDKFCGTSCHVPMEPEFTAYSNSPHAKVGCVKCHIGSGADWFVKSKLSGSYQLYAVMFNKFPRPIKTPIKNLRPAQQTCEQCHWPKQFYSEKLVSKTYFTSGDKHTKWKLDLLMKVGGGNVEAGPATGIHWHMNIGNKVTYIATDEGRQVIPWVRSEGPDGRSQTYRSTDSTVGVIDSLKTPTRRMDCIDCHNRPAHIYRPPARSVNHLMALGSIDPSLPNAKDLSVFVLETPYSSSAAAADSIRIAINEFYASNFPAVRQTKGKAIDRMITEVQGIYAKNYFPLMNTSWKRFPDNIGHLYFPGCFRCHDGKHVSESGKVLSKDCNACHAILAQQFERDTVRIALKGIKYQHPVDVGDAWETSNCSECHNPPATKERVLGGQVKH